MKLALIDAISSRGSLSKSNEDLLVSHDEFVVILDGATGLGESLLNLEVSDAAWYVNALGEHLKSVWQGNFVNALTRAHAIVFEQFNQLSSSVKTERFNYPSSGLIAMCIEQEQVTMYRMGDCVSYQVDNQFLPLFPKSKLEALDEKAIAELSVYLNQGMDYKDARKRLLPTLKRHRGKINQPTGYQALSLASETIGAVDKYVLGQDELAHKYLLASDGFSSLFQHYARDVNSDITIPLSAMLDSIRKTERDDMQLKKYPRLKPHDDATAALIKIT